MLTSYIKSELAVPVIYEQPLRDSSPLQTIGAFLRVPLRLVRLMLVCALVSFDAFLSHLTFLPLRAVLAGVRLVAASFRSSLESSVIDQIELQLGLHMLAGLYFLGFMNAKGIEIFIRRQNSAKLYVLFGILQHADTVLCSWAATWISYMRNARTWVHVLLTAVVVQLFKTLHAFVLFVQVVCCFVAVSGGEKGIGSGNRGGMAILALLIPVQLQNELKIRYRGWTVEEYFDFVVGDVSRSCHYFALFLLASLFYKENFWDGVIIFFIADWSLQLLKQLTITRSSTALSSDVHDELLGALCERWMNSRSFLYLETFNDVSVALALVSIRIAQGTFGKIVAAYYRLTPTAYPYAPVLIEITAVWVAKLALGALLYAIAGYFTDDDDEEADGETDVVEATSAKDTLQPRPRASPLRKAMSPVHTIDELTQDSALPPPRMRRRASESSISRSAHRHTRSGSDGSPVPYTPHRPMHRRKASWLRVKIPMSRDSVDLSRPSPRHNVSDSDTASAGPRISLHSSPGQSVTSPMILEEEGDGFELDAELEPKLSRKARKRRAKRERQRRRREQSSDENKKTM